MPVVYKSGGGGNFLSGQANKINDIVRYAFQLSTVATVLLWAYLLYGLLAGDVSHWGTLSPADRTRIAQNVHGAVNYLNIATGILLLTSCFLYYDEEAIGYVLVGTSVALYYGLPVLMDTVFPGVVAEWEKTGNMAANAILNQLKLAALMCAIPGGVLTIRDMFLRVSDGASRKAEDFGKMQYGGKVAEQEVTANPLLGMFAKCWQMPYCRPAIRRGCPIYQARTKCWKERVGCMCEENVIRHSMDTLISKQDVNMAEPVKKEESIIPGLSIDKSDISGQSRPEMEKTVEVPAHEPARNINPKQVRIPHNPNITMAAKVARCRDCVIYNEHQRYKYQMLSPVFILALPVLVITQFDMIGGLLNRILQKVDVAMTNLSLVQSHDTTGSLGLGGGMVQYVVVGCLTIIGTTMMLRLLEYLVFKLKL